MAANPYDQFDEVVPKAASTGSGAVAAGARDGSPSNPYDQFDHHDTSKPTTAPAAVGKSGVTREQRQQQIAVADNALDFQGRLASLNRQESIGRSLGLGGRAMLEGLAAIPDVVISPLTHLVEKATRPQATQSDLVVGRTPKGVEMATIGQSVGKFADWIGAPKPENAQERLASDMTAAVSGSATGIGLGRTLASSGKPLIAGIGNILSADPGLQLASAVAGSGAAGATREAGGGTASQIAAGVAGGFLPGTAAAFVPSARAGLVPYGAGQATKNLLRGRDEMGSPVSPEAVQSSIADFAASGANPSVGQATGGRFAQAMETMLGNVPGGAGPMARLGNQQKQAAARATERMADNLSPRGRSITPEQVGRTIAEGIEGKSPVAFVPKTAKKADELYDKVSERISPDSRVTVNNTREALADLNASIEGAPNVAKLFQNARIQGIEGALEKDVGGIEAALQRPDVRARADEIRSKLYDEAQSMESQRASAEQQLRNELTSKAEAAQAENARLQPLGLGAPHPVMSPLQIEEQVKSAVHAMPRGLKPAEIEQRVAEHVTGMADGRLPYQALAKLRTLVGRELDNYSLADNVPRDKWKTLYGALTSDMAAAAMTPDAQQAWRRANAYYAARANRIDAIAHVVDKSGGPEAIYKAAFGNTRDGATTLRAVMQSLPTEGQRELTASFIRRMGRATGSQQGADGDAFSMETFLTNWANMSPEAKRVLFDRHGLGFRQDMDKIARMADSIRRGSGVFKNPSGTGRLISLITQTTGTLSSAATAMAAGSPVAAGAVVAGSIGTAGLASILGRAMTSPGVVRWVAQNGQKPLGELVAQLHTLRAISDREENPAPAELADALEVKAGEGSAPRHRDMQR